MHPETRALIEEKYKSIGVFDYPSAKYAEILGYLEALYDFKLITLAEYAEFDKKFYRLYRKAIL